MNEIAKRNISEKLFKAIKEEKMPSMNAARSIGLIPAYISMMKKEEYWNKCAKAAWEAVLMWVNSGYSLREYPKHRPEAGVKQKADTIVSDTEKLQQQPNSDLRQGTTGIPSSPKRGKPSILFTVNLAQIGWINGLARKGKSVDQISKELHIYDEIVREVVLTKQRAEIKEKKEEKILSMSQARLIPLLKEERIMLTNKIEAIDLLLETYEG